MLENINGNQLDKARMTNFFKTCGGVADPFSFASAKSNNSDDTVGDENGSKIIKSNNNNNLLSTSFPQVKQI